MIHLVVFIFISTFIAGCVSTPGSEESWHLLPVKDNLMLLSSPDLEDGKIIGGAMFISITCKYNIKDIASECLTAFTFMRYPDNYGVFPQDFKPHKFKVGFKNKDSDSYRHFDFYAFSKRSFLVSPDQVDDFLSILSSSDKISFNISWNVIRATYDETYDSIFTFELKNTPLAISRFKNLVITKSPQKLQEPQKPKKISDIISNYI